jgi:cytochrome b involved in lipid metabolism
MHHHSFTRSLTHSLTVSLPSSSNSLNTSHTSSQMGNKNSTSTSSHSADAADKKTKQSLQPEKRIKDEKNVITNDKITSKTKKKIKKKEGKKGYQLSDWLSLVEDPCFGTGTPSPREVTRTELSKHVTEDDCWTILHGKVYDITAYMAYHPGGKRELMKGAGKDCTAMFNKFHAYVEYELILSKCEVGVLVEGGDDVIQEGDEEDED